MAAWAGSLPKCSLKWIAPQPGQLGRLVDCKTGLRHHTQSLGKKYTRLSLVPFPIAPSETGNGFSSSCVKPSYRFHDKPLSKCHSRAIFFVFRTWPSSTPTKELEQVHLKVIEALALHDSNTQTRPTPTPTPAAQGDPSGSRSVMVPQNCNGQIHREPEKKFLRSPPQHIVLKSRKNAVRYFNGLFLFKGVCLLQTHHPLHLPAC